MLQPYIESAALSDYVDDEEIARISRFCREAQKCECRLEI